MNTFPSLIRVGEQDIVAASKTLARAFINDPMMTYICPHEPDMERKLALLFEVMIRYGLKYGEVYATSAKMEGVVMWLSSDNSDMTVSKLEACGLADFASQVPAEVLMRLIFLNDFAYSRNKLHAPFTHWYLAFIGVDPAFHAKGFASALLRPMLERMDREDMPCYLETATEKNVTMYEHYGFKLIEKVVVAGTDVAMYAMLRGTIAFGMTDTNILIRPERSGDFSAIKEVNDLAFKQENESRLIEALRATKEFIPELSLVAQIEGAIAGHILLYPMYIYDGVNRHVSLALAPMSVRPDQQKKGIGGDLVKEGLQRAREKGFRSVIVIGHPDYYPRFGFCQARAFGIKTPFKVSDNAFMALELVRDGLKDVQGVVEYPKPYLDTL